MGAFVLYPSTRRMALRVRNTRDPMRAPLRIDKKNTDISGMIRLKQFFPFSY